MATSLRDLLLDLNKVRYSAGDFHTHIDDIISRMQIKFAADFNDFQSSSLAMMFIDLIAFGLDTLSFYLDRRATDNYLSTARSRKSISKLARQLGYKIKGAVPASVDLTVSLTTAQIFPVTIPLGFKFRTADNIVYETAQSTTYTIGSGIADTQLIPCYQGETNSESFQSTGLPNQIFNFSKVPDDKFISFGSVSVIVNGSPFPEEPFISFDATDQFEVSYLDLPPTLRFGDGFAGTIPIENGTIQATYIVTQGKSGLVPAATITSTVSPLVVGGSTINLTITNLESSIGGDDTENIESVRNFAGKIFKARDVAITEGDYEALAGSYADATFGRVAIAKAISSKSAATDIELQNQIITINSAVNDAIPNVTTLLSTISSAMDLIDEDISNILNLQSNMDTLISAVDDNLQDVLTQERINKNTAQEITLQATYISTDVSSVIATITAIPLDSINSLTSATKTSLLNLLTSINSNNGSVIDGANVIGSGATTAISVLGDSRDSIETIQDDSASIATDIASVVVLLGDIATPSGIRSDMIDIGIELSDESETVDIALSDISTHINQVLAADCSANLVSVPILAFDNAGFYAAPSIGLIRSLQNFLNTRKEVSQIVNVTSGVESLIPAVVTVRIGIFTGNSESVMGAIANSIVEGVLRNRKFGESLYISDILCNIKDLPGVSFTNININGHLENSTLSTGKLDGNGNLIIYSNEVITKGTITISVETII